MAQLCRPTLFLYPVVKVEISFTYLTLMVETCEKIVLCLICQKWVINPSKQKPLTSHVATTYLDDLEEFTNIWRDFPILSLW